MLRGEPGGSLKGAEVPMRTRTTGRGGGGEGGGQSVSIRDLEGDGDDGLEDFSALGKARQDRRADMAVQMF